ncbi:hypothetical protein Rhopal_007721-T1 [Rhodotorula paludigena]|uniref:Uncharacterized protein n=1 Tax=Rhodotorula paludigena TaxID=86838 RepID=A0AAV5GWP2_9BASI|nr:hypothetical protein Rhopal_007721-T1 [Rhodotorula paludigena]
MDSLACPRPPAGNVPPAAPSQFAVSPLSPTAPKRTLSAPPLFSSYSSASAFLSAQDRSLTEEGAAGAGEADEDPAISELLEIFSHPGALLVPSPTASTPRAASSSSRSTILLAPGPAAVGAVAGVRTPSRIGAHARRRSSAGSAGTAAADAAGGGGVDYVAAARAARRTPPFGPGFGGGAWEGLPHSPPSRALTRNPFPRHAHSAYPVLQLAPSAVSPTIHSTNKAQGQQPAQVEPSRESSGLGAPRGPAALAASTAQGVPAAEGEEEDTVMQYDDN